MKIKNYIYLLLLCTALCIAPNGICAQSSATTFTDGITVAVKTESKPPSPEMRPPGISSRGTFSTSNGKNIIHRALVDRTSKVYFGYDVEVSAIEGSSKFKVAFKPLSIDPQKLVKDTTLTAFKYDKYPEESIVEDGDIIFFDTLENPQTKVRLSDLIKVTRKKSEFVNYFAERDAAKDFSIDDVEMRGTDLEAYINGKKIGQVKTIAGSSLSFYAQGKGRFVMSIFPGKSGSMQKIGLVQNNELTFIYNGDNYKFVSSSPLVGTGGKWNVWIKHEPNYKPSFDSPYMFGAGPIE